MSTQEQQVAAALRAIGAALVRIERELDIPQGEPSLSDRQEFVRRINNELAKGRG